jgi:hypothetical protein
MRIASFSTRSPPHSSKYFLTSTKIASATVFLVPGFGMRAISFATCTASGERCSALSVCISNAFNVDQPASILADARMTGYSNVLSQAHQHVVVPAEVAQIVLSLAQA